MGLVSNALWVLQDVTIFRVMVTYYVSLLGFDVVNLRYLLNVLGTKKLSDKNPQLTVELNGC